MTRDDIITIAGRTLVLAGLYACVILAMIIMVNTGDPTMFYAMFLKAIVYTGYYSWSWRFITID